MAYYPAWLSVTDRIDEEEQEEHHHQQYENGTGEIINFFTIYSLLTFLIRDFSMDRSSHYTMFSDRIHLDNSIWVIRDSSG